MVRNAGRETLLIADGFSCRTQVEQLTDRRALHTAQVIRMAMEHGSDSPAGSYPESSYPDVVLDGQPTVPPARLAAAVAAGSIAVGGALAARHARRR